MKAIIIEEDRFCDLTDSLELALNSSQTDNTAERLGWDKDIWRAAVTEAHRRYHHHFVRWAQSHGASCVKRKRMITLPRKTVEMALSALEGCYPSQADQFLAQADASNALRTALDAPEKPAEVEPTCDWCWCYENPKEAAKAIDDATAQIAELEKRESELNGDLKQCQNYCGQYVEQIAKLKAGRDELLNALIVARNDLDAVGCHSGRNRVIYALAKLSPGDIEGDKS